MSIATEFVTISARQLETHLGRIETCASKLTQEQIWARAGEHQNAVGNLMLHLAGNLRQWILSGVGGAPDQRMRDAEFDARDGGEPWQLIGELSGVVHAAAETIGRLTPEQLQERVTIQNQNVTKLEAVYHVVEHFVGHTFQIIFATKLLTGQDLGFYAHLSRKK
jgi:uncharacterized damage-inducible protein DinB